MSIAMAPALRTAAIALALAAGPALARDRANYNRSLNSAHQPIVSRTDYSLDVGAIGDGLAPGEAERLGMWLDQLRLGYGDTVTLAGGTRPHDGADGVGRVLSRYGMLVSAAPPPLTAGRPAPGSVRIVVSRAIARVEGCPDWSRGNYAEFEGASRSNYGCAAAQNLAAMIANPQDLVEGASANEPADAGLSVKAIATYRDMAPTGKGGLKSESSKGN